MENCQELIRTLTYLLSRNQYIVAVYFLQRRPDLNALPPELEAMLNLALIGDTSAQPPIYRPLTPKFELLQTFLDFRQEGFFRSDKAFLPLITADPEDQELIFYVLLDTACVTFGYDCAAQILAMDFLRDRQSPVIQLFRAATADEPAEVRKEALENLGEFDNSTLELCRQKYIAYLTEDPSELLSRWRAIEQRAPDDWAASTRIVHCLASKWHLDEAVDHGRRYLRTQYGNRPLLKQYAWCLRERGDGLQAGLVRIAEPLLLWFKLWRSYPDDVIKTWTPPTGAT